MNKGNIRQALLESESPAQALLQNDLWANRWCLLQKKGLAHLEISWKAGIFTQCFPKSSLDSSFSSCAAHATCCLDLKSDPEQQITSSRIVTNKFALHLDPTAVTNRLFLELKCSKWARLISQSAIRKVRVCCPIRFNVFQSVIWRVTCNSVDMALDR